MSHSFTVDALNKIGNEAKKLGDAMSYLHKLGPLHRWVMRWPHGRGQQTSKRVTFKAPPVQLRAPLELGHLLNVAKPLLKGPVFGPPPVPLLDSREVSWHGTTEAAATILPNATDLVFQLPCEFNPKRLIASRDMRAREADRDRLLPGNGLHDERLERRPAPGGLRAVEIERCADQFLSHQLIEWPHLPPHNGPTFNGGSGAGHALESQ
jgi:hypothetical protein